MANQKATQSVHSSYYNVINVASHEGRPYNMARGEIGGKICERPINWDALFAVRPDSEKFGYDHVLYVYNCNTIAYRRYNETYPFMPIYHAAVVFSLKNRITRVLLVAESEMLMSLRVNFPPEEIPADEDGATIAGKIKGVSFEKIDLREAPQYPILNHLENAEIEFCLYWEDIKERRFYDDLLKTSKIMSPATAGLGMLALDCGCYELQLPNVKLFLHFSGALLTSDPESTKPYPDRCKIILYDIAKSDAGFVKIGNTRK